MDKNFFSVGILVVGLLFSCNEGKSQQNQKQADQSAAETVFSIVPENMTVDEIPSSVSDAECVCWFTSELANEFNYVDAANGIAVMKINGKIVEFTLKSGGEEGVFTAQSGEYQLDVKKEFVEKAVEEKYGEKLEYMLYKAVIKLTDGKGRSVEKEMEGRSYY